MGGTVVCSGMQGDSGAQCYASTHNHTLTHTLTATLTRSLSHAQGHTLLLESITLIHVTLANSCTLIHTHADTLIRMHNHTRAETEAPCCESGILAPHTLARGRSTHHSALLSTRGPIQPTSRVEVTLLSGICCKKQGEMCNSGLN